MKLLILIVVVLSSVVVIFFVSTIIASLFVIDTGRQCSDEPYTIIVLPDSQKYVKFYPEIFPKQMDWIVKNKDELNIKMVLHVGDVVEESDSIPQFTIARAGFDKLDDANIPYLISQGNHDIHSGDFGNYFKGLKNFSLMKIGCDKIGFVSIGWTNELLQLEIADKIISKNQDYQFVVVTHSFVNDNPNCLSKGAGDFFGGEVTWNNSLTKHDNLFMVVSGHTTGITERYCQFNKTNQQVVHGLLSNYQTEQNGGDGKLRVYTFSLETNNVSVRTYNVNEGMYMTNKSSEFSFYIK